MQRENITFEQLPAIIGTLIGDVNEIKHLLLNLSIDNPVEKEDKLLTIQQAAEFLTLSVPTIYSKVSRAELPVMKRGKRLYFSEKELLDYIKEGRRKSVTEIEEEAAAYFSNKRNVE